VDDVMISLAAPQGSVGPHVDSYDVFLLQGRGRRRWGVAEHFAETHVPGLDLRILRGFRAEREWVLGPGDMLYLPPGVAHHGVALEECLTYSIGFRAPSHYDLVAGLLQRVVAAVDRSRLYSDPGLVPARDPGEITSAALARLRRIVADGSSARPGAFVLFAGEHLTEPRVEGSSQPPRPVDASRLARRLHGGGVLVRRSDARVAFVRRRTGTTLFADGRHWTLSPALAEVAPLLTRRRRIDTEALRPLLRRRGMVGLLAELVSARVFDVEPRGRPRSRARPARGARRGNRTAAGSPRTKARR
jgi:50S ribosomal protein L16 3-hydroxylase